MASLSEEEGDIGNWLATIHLEKYRENFIQNGFYTPKDSVHFNNEALLQIGIKATGHRKRILKLAQQRSLTPNDELLNSISDEFDGDNQILERSRTVSDGKDNLNVGEVEVAEPGELVIKPIPKPRTSLNKQSSIPKSQTETGLVSGHNPNQILSLEDFTPSEIDRDKTDLIEREHTSSEKCTVSTPSEEVIPKAEEKVPPVPPRNNRGKPPAHFMMASALTSYDPDQSGTRSLPSISKFAENLQDMQFLSSVSSHSLPPIPLADTTFTGEMICNKLYTAVTASPERNRSQSFSISTGESLSRRPVPELPNTLTRPDTASLPPKKRQHLEKHSEKGTAQKPLQMEVNNTMAYSTIGEIQTSNSSTFEPSFYFTEETEDDLTISPYASFHVVPEQGKNMKCDWLEKLSPQGSYVFQKRYVKFDGKCLMYFSNEKDPYPKGVIPLTVMQMARAAKENKFEVVTSHRIYVFRAENEVQRNEWCTHLQNAVKEHHFSSPRRSGPMAFWQKFGCLELKGYKSKVYTALNTNVLWLHKNEQSFKTGIAITMIELEGATIRDGNRKSFELITPFKTFSFTAESEREKKEWVEALQDSIAETLSDYEVAEKIWSNKSNKVCADCKALNPDWASINLCVIICKRCAGVHRGLGTTISKVQSLKLDTSIWTNEIVQLFLQLGNEKANRFWAARVTPGEELDTDATIERRREFISLKYRDGIYRQYHPKFAMQEEVIKALCSAVSNPNLLQTVTQIFSEADKMNLIDPHACDTFSQSPQSPTHQSGLQYSSRRSSEISSPNSLASMGVYSEISQPAVQCGYLYKTSAMTKLPSNKKCKDEFQKQWCFLDRSLLFYETDKSPEPTGKIEMSDIVCIGVTRPQSMTNPGPIDRFRCTFEIFLSSEKLFQFGTDNPEILQMWTSSIAKGFTGASLHSLLNRQFDRIGKLRYKSMRNPEQWQEGWFILKKSNLIFCSEEGGLVEESVHLKRLQELTFTVMNEDGEKKEVLRLVDKERTLYLHGVTRLDYSVWCSDIHSAAGSRGNALCDQQLSRNEIPIIVDSCIAFITQYGLRHEGIYRKNGAKSRIKHLMDEFRKDARNVKLRAGEHFIEDVTDVLKRFFREVDDPVFMMELHSQWKEAAEIPHKSQRLKQYKEIIRGLPRVNRMTLAALIGHLYRVQKCADLNQMCTKNLSLLFAPSLFQTDGKGEQEVRVIEDLIDNYVSVFDIDDEHVTQMDLENSLIMTWKDVQLSQAGDLIMEVYVETKMTDCCITLKVSPTMTSEELTNQVLDMKNILAGEKDIWVTFEAIENGELERPLHPKEKVLEQALQWCKLAEPSSAYLVVKKLPAGEGGNLYSANKSDTPKCGVLKCREEPPKLLSGNKFHERYFVLRDRKLLLFKDKKSSKPEREWSVLSLKVYLGIKKKLKAPTVQWGFTIFSDKQQWFLCCSGQPEMWDWTACILRAQHDDLRPTILRRHSSSDVSKQKFGTMPLIPIHGDDSNAVMLSANQTLRRLHARRTLSMFFPMKMQHDLFEQQQKDENANTEPVYEEVQDVNVMLSMNQDNTPVDPTPILVAQLKANTVTNAPAQDKFLQELSSVINRKNELQHDIPKL
ncbi:arf-GAP with Rho-GAP domain, ANK repeat and PH domain-containing protein 3 isoform X1 [Carcharodon carcharias]|uniref:arf-GAP with Rho-GAP domain, ANK repeat and PH domain-containing protein 3 isoform X1 n=1 Tax=Carcharodon carcharias TaxID=13397 RepID=UPI001B7E6B0F|nr:arf-GAP with Rho-GAP domain, ANK repeat and PH domain-containing protein 3 isoform X1 [Carcharodon carcharias]XP_041049112.1 arf-GAP with Rho-GAP domain, ANK repeat and PH domain-containing protein 3 isoform X1 [Carcharodon carcharias]XP_041049113.1 arf-GAP with Rho-GAP domain, ANK repeat and PH domain-containing protein 3 isoform X1 [Carcharodon carcharias]XP_041049114.1 arf-GAP with Rho-GAP domain, ANK repeat and PH domain-containing protein 3 isoform X1 [Carcharodon carcharias]XP_04104911